MTTRDIVPTLATLLYGCHLAHIYQLSPVMRPQFAATCRILPNSAVLWNSAKFCHTMKFCQILPCYRILPNSAMLWNSTKFCHAMEFCQILLAVLASWRPLPYLLLPFDPTFNLYTQGIRINECL